MVGGQKPRYDDEKSFTQSCKSDFAAFFIIIENQSEVWYNGGTRINIIKYMSNPNPVVHFEMPYEDRQRMADFYTKTFGWQPQMLGPEMGDYVVVATAEMDEQTKFPKKPGTINGGFYKKSMGKGGTSIVIAVEDIHAAMKRVEAAGGKVLGGQNPGQPDDIPGVGLFVSIIDSEGNTVGMLEPKGMPVA
jgi:uncharacterized protein